MESLNEGFYITRSLNFTPFIFAAPFVRKPLISQKLRKLSLVKISDAKVIHRVKFPKDISVHCSVHKHGQDSNT